jgi:3-phenylpropionate/trans-cinnamate dioxygenase ferredoxin subunit
MAFEKVTKAEEVAEGTARVFTVENTRIAVCNIGGKFFAIDDICTHDNGPLGEGELVDGEIECPRHGARFDVKTGKALCLPAVKPVNAYPVEEKQGELWVDVKERAKK